MQSGRPGGQTNEYRQPITDRYGRPLPMNNARQPHQAARRMPQGAAPAHDVRYPSAAQTGGHQQMPRGAGSQPDRRSLAVSYSSVRQGGSVQRGSVAPMNIPRTQPIQRGPAVSGAYHGGSRTPSRAVYPPQKRPVGGNHKVNRIVKGNKKSRRRTTIRDFVLGLVIGFAIFGPAAYFVCKTIIGIFA